MVIIDDQKYKIAWERGTQQVASSHSIESVQLRENTLVPPQAISGAITDRHYEKLLTLGVSIALLLHAAFIPLFFILEILVLGLANIGSALLYAIALSLLKREEYWLAILICWVELIGYTALAVKTLGWQSGFHYYMLLFIPLIFASATNRFSVVAIKAILICLVYLIIDVWFRTGTPNVILDEAMLSYIRYGNILIVFMFLGYVIYSYIQVVYAAESQLVRYAITDPLTGLYNRRYIYQLGRYQERLHKREGHPFSIILADIDGFKSINDSYGHEAGDSVLITLSHKLCNGLREQDSVARWGGEEYLILLPNTRQPEAVMVAGRIGKLVSSESQRIGNSDIQLTMTFGVSEFDPDEGIDDCIARADQAMLSGKKSGKNRIVSS